MGYYFSFGIVRGLAITKPYQEMSVILVERQTNHLCLLVGSQEQHCLYNSLIQPSKTEILRLDISITF